MRSGLIRWLVSLLVSCFVASSASAQIEAASAERLLRKSGTLAQIDAIAPQFRAGFEDSLRKQPGSPLKQSEIARMSAVADRAFAASKMQSAVVATVAERMSAANLDALDRWYESELGKRMTAFEVEAAKADQAQAIEAARQLVATLPAPRIELVRELVAATRAADFIVDLTVNMTVAIAYGASLASSEVEVTPLNELRKLVLKDREQIAGAMNELLLAVYAKTYEKASDADLKSYAAFMKTAAGAQFTEAVIVAFERSLMTGAADFGRGLVEQRKSAKT
jgi:hypothetical protein